MNEGSLRGAMLNMLMTALGVGIFSLHKIYNDVGIYNGIIMVVVIGLYFALAMDMIIYA